MVIAESRRTACLLDEDIRNKTGVDDETETEEGKFRKKEQSTFFGVLHKAEGAVLGAGYRFALLVAMPALTHGTAVGV